jgi:hypothetical protein
MARVPVEVVTVSDNHLASISSAIALANAEQDEFVFDVADEDFSLHARMRALNRESRQRALR